MDHVLRLIVPIACEGDMLMATLDPAPGRCGLLIVSGGNEIRCGAHRGMALLAGELAARGVPVFRYDRRGIGDSTGTNDGFLSACADLHAAAAAFRGAMPQVREIVGFGNCDAASTLALFGRGAGIDRVVLANPWVIEATDDLPPAAAIRRRYSERLRRPSEWRRLILGEIDFGKLRRGLAKIWATPHEPLATTIVEAVASWGSDARIVVAEGDATAIAFADATCRAGRVFTTHPIPTDSHSFARAGDAAALRRVIWDAVASAGATPDQTPSRT
jgi:exosortase A-associated hydrolase 1